MVRVMDVRDYASMTESSMTAMESRLSADIGELRGDIAGLRHNIQLLDTKGDTISDRVDQRMDQGVPSDRRLPRPPPIAAGTQPCPRCPFGFRIRFLPPAVGCC